jgi:ketosteroid isomerase-like protein
MYAWIVRSMLRRAIQRLNAGDIMPLLRSFADDATLVFPGDTSWSARYQGKDEIAGFLRRFVRAGIQLEPQEIVVKGPPWNTRAFMRFTDQATASDGTVVYANRGVILATAAWGKVRFQEDYLDTQKVAAFDEYLSSREPAGA